MFAHLCSVPSTDIGECCGSSYDAVKLNKFIGIQEAESLLVAKGAYETTVFTAQGPAGIFALYVAPGAKLGQVLLNEFVCVCGSMFIQFVLADLTNLAPRFQDFVIGLTIWACLDPTNFLSIPAASPWIVALV